MFAANSVEHRALFQSGWFIEGLLSQTLVVHMLRTQKIPFIQSTAALPVLLTTGLVMALGIYIPFSPLGARLACSRCRGNTSRGWPLRWSATAWSRS